MSACARARRWTVLRTCAASPAHGNGSRLALQSTAAAPPTAGHANWAMGMNRRHARGTLSPKATVALAAWGKGVILGCQAHNERLIGARGTDHEVLQNCSSRWSSAPECARIRASSASSSPPPYIGSRYLGRRGRSAHAAPQARPCQHRDSPTLSHHGVRPPERAATRLESDRPPSGKEERQGRHTAYDYAADWHLTALAWAIRATRALPPQPRRKPSPEPPKPPRNPSRRLSAAERAKTAGRPSWNGQPKRDWAGPDPPPRTPRRS
jgi:hypothetical protein